MFTAHRSIRRFFTLSTLMLAAGGVEAVQYAVRHSTLQPVVASTRQPAGSTTSRPLEVPARPVGIADPTNAALVHMRGWQMVPPDAWMEFGLVYDANKELVPGWKPSAELNTSLVRLESMIQQAIRASHLPEADWGIQWSDGYMALLPHLGRLRESSRILELEARAKLASQDPEDHDAGVEALAAMIRISRHTNSDRVLISSLVGGAIAARSSAVIQALADQNVFSAADAGKLLAAVKTLDAQDPFNITESMKTDAWMGADAIFRTGPNAGGESAKAIREIMAMGNQVDPEAEENLKLVAAMDEASLRADLARHAEYTQKVAALYAERGRDGIDEIRALRERALDGEFGVTLRYIASDVVKAYESDARNREALSTLVARLQGIR